MQYVKSVCVKYAVMQIQNSQIYNYAESPWWASSFILYFLHLQKVIDVIKVDIEGAEWPFLRQVLKTDKLKYVKQLIFELHTPIYKTDTLTVEHFSIYNDLMEVKEKWGFELYLEHHKNDCCPMYGVIVPQEMVQGAKMDLCCFELFFLNKNFK